MASAVYEADPDDLAGIIRRELGVEVPYATYSYDWGDFFANAELRDVLDAVTEAWKILVRKDNFKAKTFVTFVERALREEGLAYRIDAQGGVHLQVDKAFEVARISAVAELGGARYGAAREAFDRCHACLDGLPPDTLGAVRGIFDACESVFKQFSKEPRLGAAEIGRVLKPAAKVQFSGPAVPASERLLSSFADWTNAVHQYRHAPGELEPSPPPIVLAIALVSTGTAFLRWLISFDTPAGAQ